MTNFEKILEELKALAQKTIHDCTFSKDVEYLGEKTRSNVLLPSGDEKYGSFWVRDAAMMSESGLLSDDDLKRYVEIFATHAQNGSEMLSLENELKIPPYAIADHIFYDGGAVFFPGSYPPGTLQGDGSLGFFPPYCDNYYFIIMVGQYVEQSGDSSILSAQYGGLTLLQRLEYAFRGYNIDKDCGLCVSDPAFPTVDWGFVDTVKKTGKLLMSSLLRYQAANTLACLLEELGEQQRATFYRDRAQRIRESVLETFFDGATGWFYSATGIGHQYDVWATAFAVFLGITRNEKTLKALYDGYRNGTAVVDGYVRHILTDHDFSSSSAWESSLTPLNEYQNGAYWATPTGWYAYALYEYGGQTDILSDFLRHTQRYVDLGAPYEWIDARTEKVSGLNYGTSGVLPYIGAKKIAKKFF